MSGLLVCNHLSYLDILVLGALSPAAFVAKREVKSWPILGLFATLAGTVFVDRRKRTRVGEATEKMENLLKTGVVTVSFPEGTSSDGRTVLPFKSALLEPATKSSCSLSAGWLGYELEEGDPGGLGLALKKRTENRYLLVSCFGVRFCVTPEHG